MSATTVPLTLTAALEARVAAHREHQRAAEAQAAKEAAAAHEARTAAQRRTPQAEAPPVDAQAISVAAMTYDDTTGDDYALEVTARHLAVPRSALKVHRVRAAIFAARLATAIEPWVVVRGWTRPLRLVKSELRTQLENPAYQGIAIRYAEHERVYVVLGFGSREQPA